MKTKKIILMMGVFLGVTLSWSKAFSNQKIAPNLMIIFGNSFSMNRMLDDSTLPSVASTPYPHFNDDGYVPADPSISDGLHGQFGPGTPFIYPALGDQPLSKLVIAKNSLKSVLDSDLSNDINFGFATFRTIFGLEVATTAFYTNSTWPVVHPKNANIFFDTNPNKLAYGDNPANFAYVKWYRQWVPDPAGGRVSFLGKGFSNDGSFAKDNNKGVIDDSSVQYFSGHDLPHKFMYKNAIGNQAYSFRLQRNQEIADQTWTKSDWPDFITNSTGATGQLDGYSSLRLTHRLCRTFYSSQQNYFQAHYITEDGRMFRDSYASSWSGNTLYFVPPGETRFDHSGSIPANATPIVCFDGWVQSYKTQSTRLTNQFRHDWKSDGKAAYFNYVPSFFSATNVGIPAGALTGWSGANVYNYNKPSEWDGEYVANYPSGVANIDNIGLTQAQKDNLSKYLISDAAKRHMGVFLDLPDPSHGYVDQRSIIKGFLGQVQMGASGLDYDPQTHQISHGRGIAASSHPWIVEQSPIYDSLLAAKAYYRSYREKDPYRDCRQNFVLLFYDGKEDAHKNPDGTFKDPSIVAARLFNEENVKTFVIIISNNQGDIAQANSIAQAGGTDRAYVANSSTSLLTAFQSVFAQLTGPVYKTAVGLPSRTQDIDAGLAVVPQYDEGAKKGSLLAYQISNYKVSDAIMWDAERRMQINGASDRSNRLYSIDSSTPNASGNPVLIKDIPDARFLSSSPAPSEIKNYTINPSYNNGHYLAGRAYNSFIGRFSHPSMQPKLIKLGSTSLVLATSDDGFVYAFDGATGNLKWGWMPQTFLDELKYYSTFWKQGNMNGGFSVFVDEGGVYVAGSARRGKLHYVLKLDSSGNLNKVLYQDEEFGWFTPEFDAPVIWKDGSDIKLAYVLTPENLSGGSKIRLLKINSMTGQVSLVDSNLDLIISSNLEQISQVCSSADKNKRLVVAGRESSGQQRRLIALLKDEASGISVEASKFYPNDPQVGHASPRWVAVTDPSLVDAKGFDVTYVVASADDHVLAIRGLGSCPKQWSYRWASYKTGGGCWDGSEKWSPSSGSASPAYDKVQSIPNFAEVTGKVKPIGDIVYAPVAEINNTNPMTCSSKTAKMYLYQLQRCGFPKGTFYITYYDNGRPEEVSYVLENITIGSGNAYEAQVLPGTSHIMFNSELTLGTSPALNITPPSLTGNRRIMWRELFN